MLLLQELGGWWNYHVVGGGQYHLLVQCYVLVLWRMRSQPSGMVLVIPFWAYLLVRKAMNGYILILFMVHPYIIAPMYGQSSNVWIIAIHQRMVHTSERYPYIGALSIHRSSNVRTGILRRKATFQRPPRVIHFNIKRFSLKGSFIERNSLSLNT